MSSIQEDIYQEFCSGKKGEQLISAMNAMINGLDKTDISQNTALSASLLKSLLYLRLVCTHPYLVMGKGKALLPGKFDNSKTCTVEESGKLMALRDLLRDAGLNVNDISAADNDSSLIYCGKADEQTRDRDECDKVLDPSCDDSILATNNRSVVDYSISKCLIFGQFTSSLDIVEKILLNRYLPSVKYLRLDGRVPVSKRSEIVQRFNNDKSVKILLLTTKIGHLGLNLASADTVIFLELDWNPMTDLQAMNRAHRLGQKHTVNVYQLVTMNSIEEKTILLQERKLAMSKAIVNTDNSSIYCMGTDRLLDIFQFRSESSSTSSQSRADLDYTLDSVVERYQDEYKSLSLRDFLSGFQNESVRSRCWRTKTHLH